MSRRVNRKSHAARLPLPMMPPVLAGLLVCLCLPGTAAAQDVFVPPQQHSRERYESGWMKNPFTLKTAPVVEAKKSFAQDLVLYNVNRVMNEITVVVANKKTKEFFRLKNTEPASTGMKIRSAMIQDSRKDTYVEVELNGESAVLRHDDAFRKQMLAGNSARGSRGPGAPRGNGTEPGAVPGEAAPAAGTTPTPGQGPAARSRNTTGTAPTASVARPPLPQRLTPQPPTEAESIRPGPGPQRPLPMPPHGAPPTTRSRRFFTAPASAPSPAAAPASPQETF